MTAHQIFSNRQVKRRKELIKILSHSFDKMTPPNQLQQARFLTLPEEELKWCIEKGCVPVYALDILLHNLLEAAEPGHLAFSCRGLRCISGNTSQMLGTIFDLIYATVMAYLNAAGNFQPKEREEQATSTAFVVLENLPRLRERAEWNIFASLRDPAVWDQHSRKLVVQTNELPKLDLQPQIDRAIRERDKDPFKHSLSQYGLLKAYDYLLELVRRSYPGWKVLFFHDIVHLLAKDSVSHLMAAESSVTIPFLPRVISEHVANLYQADVHPETIIGDANFIDHPHRGLTTGQTGRIGNGCVIYPCTLGGVTDKVKPRHPIIGNFIVLGTDCGLFGVVKIGDDSVIGANAKVVGNVVMETEVHIGMGAVVGTIREGNYPPGEILLKRKSSVGDGSVVENRHTTPLVIPEGFEIPAHCHVINDGAGHPEIVKNKALKFFNAV